MSVETAREMLGLEEEKETGQIDKEVKSENETRAKAELARIGEATLLKKELEVRREQLKGVQGAHR